MSDEFKRKLAAYEEGQLTGEELIEFENELKRLENYQTILDDEPNENLDDKLTNKKQQRIMLIGKWKARLQTALTALALLFLFTVISSILTAFFYSWGTPDRSEVYSDIIDHTLAITDPYAKYGGTSTGTKPFFGLEATRDINKVVGSEVLKVGEIEVNFLLSMMGYPEVTSLVKEAHSYANFSHPASSESLYSEWDRLEKLPEGTVISAYVSFNSLIETSTVEDLFSAKDMDLLWLAVDTGEAVPEYDYYIFNPIGFPSSPIWHDDDMIVTSQKTERGFFGTRVREVSSMSPEYKEGDQDMLHEQFIKTLQFLNDYSKKASRLVFGSFDIKEILTYIESNGIQHYGAVITGPTKEILKLQDESIISQLIIDEVEFWNWN